MSAKVSERSLGNALAITTSAPSGRGAQNQQPVAPTPRGYRRKTKAGACEATGPSRPSPPGTGARAADRRTMQRFAAGSGAASPSAGPPMARQDQVLRPSPANARDTAVSKSLKFMVQPQAEGIREDRMTEPGERPKPETGASHWHQPRGVQPGADVRARHGPGHCPAPLPSAPTEPPQNRNGAGQWPGPC